MRFELVEHAAEAQRSIALLRRWSHGDRWSAVRGLISALLLCLSVSAPVLVVPLLVAASCSW